MRSQHPNRYASAALVVLATLLPAAFGQNALGDGRQLDASLSTSTRYNPIRVDPSAEFRFRNAIATGNAPGGMSLRADVGYRSAYEFRGELGSDDLFSFRRDSLYSGLAGMGIRGTDAIQYQFALTTGSQLPQNIVGSAMVIRGGVPVRNSSGTGSVSSLRRESQDELEESDRLTGLLRSPSSYATTRSLRPVFLGFVSTQSGDAGERGVSASALRGVRIIEMSSPGSDEAESQRVKTVHDTIMETLRIKSQVDTSAGQQDQTTDRVGQPEDWRSRLDALRLQLLTGEMEGAGTPAEKIPGENSNEGDSKDRLPVVPAVPGVSDEKKPALRFDPETLDLIRPDGEVIEALINPDSPIDSIYVNHMETGQHLLSIGRYFDAEERFTRALSIRSGDVAAQVGRLHSQLGAGLFISAGLNLRELMMTSPEVAATRFASGLLPGDERAAQLVVLLRERAGLSDAGPSGDPLLTRETALLLAYLSYQRGEGELVSAGLTAAEKTLTTEEREVGGPDARLIAYLTQLWIPSESVEPEGE